MQQQQLATGHITRIVTAIATTTPNITNNNKVSVSYIVDGEDTIPQYSYASTYVCVYKCIHTYVFICCPTCRLCCIFDTIFLVVFCYFFNFFFFVCNNESSMAFDLIIHIWKHLKRRHRVLHYTYPCLNRKSCAHSIVH